MFSQPDLTLALPAKNMRFTEAKLCFAITFLNFSSDLNRMYHHWRSSACLSPCSKSLQTNGIVAAIKPDTNHFCTWMNTLHFVLLVIKQCKPEWNLGIFLFSNEQFIKKYFFNKWEK